MPALVISDDAVSRLRRVGLRVGEDPSGSPTVERDPTTRPVVDRYTLARILLWGICGYVGLDRGTSYLALGIYEIWEAERGRELLETPQHKGADLVAGIAGFEAGRYLRGE